MDKKQSPAGSVDLLHGPIMRNIFIFMVPVFISNIFQQFYNVADTALVGNYLGENALAAVGSVSSIFEFLVFFSQNLGVGLSFVVGREFGKNNPDRLKQAVAGAVLIGSAVSIALTMLTYFGMRHFLILLNTPREVLDNACAYIRVICLFIIIMFIYNLCSGVLRAIGNSVMPLIFLIISSLMNIGLDIVMIRVFHMGVVGTAIATVTAQGIAATLCILYILRRVHLVIPGKEHFEYDSGLYKELASQGIAMASMGSIVNIGSIILQIGINSLGAVVIAGHVAARKIFFVLLTLSISMSTAVANFVSQNRGANNRKRILEAIRKSHIFCIVTTAVMIISMFFFAKSLIALISGSDNPIILRNGSVYLRFCTFFFVPLLEIQILRNSLQSMGSRIIPIISSVIELVGKIFFTIALIPRFGYNAVIVCEPLIWIVMAAQLLYAFYHDPFIKASKGPQPGS